MIRGLRGEGLAIRRGDRLLFRDIELSLAPGEAAALTGPNGAGKTSLLRAIAGFIALEAGRIAFLDETGEVDADEARRRHTHLLGDQDGLKAQRSARDELVFQAGWTGGDREAALAAAEMLGLARALDLAVRQLSAGQRRRLALCRLVASPRSLWLLDEPLAPLDARHRALFGDVARRHLAGGGLVLAAVHDPLPFPARALELRT